MLKLIVSFFILIGSCSLASQELPKWAEDSKTPESIIAALYESVSADPLAERNWERFENLFHKDAHLSIAAEIQGEIILQSKSPNTLANEIQANYHKIGFHEIETKKITEQHGLMANVTSYFDVKIGKKTSATLFSGINHFQLLHDGNRWWILSNTGTVLSK